MAIIPKWDGDHCPDYRLGGAHMRIDEKKARSYKEFLYILPFILLVLVFSYFPLYGWIYAFHDYQPPKPITAETFVGLKWFHYIVSNPVRTADVLRVLRVDGLERLWRRVALAER